MINNQEKVPSQVLLYKDQSAHALAISSLCSLIIIFMEETEMNALNENPNAYQVTNIS